MRNFQPWGWKTLSPLRNFQPWETFNPESKRNFQPWETSSLQKLSAPRQFQPQDYFSLEMPKFGWLIWTIILWFNCAAHHMISRKTNLEYIGHRLFLSNKIVLNLIKKGDHLLHYLAHLLKNLGVFFFYFSFLKRLTGKWHVYILSHHITNNEYPPGLNLEKNGWKFLEAESFLRLKLSRGWKCPPTESVSQLFSGLKVSQSWNFLNWKCLTAESVFHPHGWKCLAAEKDWTANFSQMKVSHGWKCL